MSALVCTTGCSTLHQQPRGKGKEREGEVREGEEIEGGERGREEGEERGIIRERQKA